MGVDSTAWWDFQPGQRVMTREGFPGVVASVEDGPVAGAEEYIVTLDNNMGGGRYASGELKPLPQTQAQVASVEHTAADDYPELGDILVRRPDHQTLIPMLPGMVSMASLDYSEHALITESANTYLMPPDFETEVEEDEDGNRHVVGSDQVLIAEGGLWDFIKGAPPPGGVGHNWSYDWCRFRRNSQCYYPKTLNEAASKTAGYAVWVPEERGFCPRITWEDQEKCPVGEPGPHAPGGYTDATVSWEEGGQHGGHPVAPYSPTAALQAVSSWDPEVRFHFTATWADVRQKAKEIAKSGGVRILAAPGNGGVSINGEVQGDTNIYMTSIVKVPGKYAIAYWECGCAWSAYSWGRTGKWKKFEGRMCSHALALNYEAQRRGMFGGTVHEDKQPTFNRDPAATTKWPGAWDRNKGRYSMKVVAAQDETHDEPPAVEFVRTAMHEGLPPNDALRMLVVMGARNPASLLALAFGGAFMAKVRGIVQRVRLTAEGLVASDGQPLDPSEVLYPTYDPHLGLSLTDHRHGAKTAAGSDPNAAARALLTIAQKHEPDTTALMKRLVNRSHGHLTGLDHRLKTADSLARKIRTEMPEFGGDAGKTAMNMSDSLRYTMLFRPEEYVDGARDTLAELQRRGYKARVKNYWERGDNYNGINAAMMTPDGHPFELQFHTPESFDIKEHQAHPLYQRFRDSKDHRERYVLDRKMVDMFDKAEQPGGVLHIPNLKKVPRVGPPAQKAAAKSGVEHTYYRRNSLEGKTVAVLRHVLDHDKQEAHMQVWRDGKWVHEGGYANHHYMGEPTSDQISEDEASRLTEGHHKDAARRDTPVEDHYIGLTDRVGGVHAVHPDDYDPNGDGFAKARCGAWVSVDHRGNEPRAFGDEDNYGDSPSCKRCRRSTKTASSDDPCTACGGTGEQGTGHECYLCDGSGSGEEERSSRAMGMDNSNPANGLPVGLDLASGQQPVVAALLASGPPLVPGHLPHAKPDPNGGYRATCECGYEGGWYDDAVAAHLDALRHIGDEVERASDGKTRGLGPEIADILYDQTQRAAIQGHRIDPQEGFEHDPGDDSITEDYAHHIHHQTQPGTHKRYPYDKPWYDPSRWGRGGFVEGAKNRYVVQCDHMRGFHNVFDNERSTVIGPSYPSHNKAVQSARNLNDEHEDRKAHPNEYEAAKKDKASDPPTVSGVVLKAADTGRVLMLQRALEDPNDKAAGTWEFPGGHHEDGDKHSLDAAIREFEEEVGQKFPEGGHLTHVWRSGPYVGHVVVVPEEKVIKFDHGRIVPNPDDPDGDNSEQVAWWDPDHARKNPALREECKGNPWADIKKAAKGTTAEAHPPVNCPAPEHHEGDGLNPAVWDEGNGYQHHDGSVGHNESSRSVSDWISHPHTTGKQAVYDDEVNLRCDKCGQEIDNRDQEARLDGVIYHPDEECPYCDGGMLRKTSRYLTVDEVMAAAGNPTPEEARALLNQAYIDQGDEWLFHDDGVSPTLAHTAAEQLQVGDKVSVDGKPGYMVAEDEGDVVRVWEPGQFHSPHTLTVQPSRLRREADLHDEPEPALPTTDGEVEGPTTDSESMAMGLQDDVTEAREDLGLPPLDAASMLRQHQAAMESGNTEASPFAHLMAGTQRSDDIASKAQEFLAKQGLKSFTPAERKELIEEGLDVQAANLDRLDIAGTHYEALDRATAARDEDDSVANFMMWG